MRLSILIPAYNAEAHLESVIGRIPRAVWPSIQSVWIINDGSRDSTGNVADQCSNADPLIKAVHFENNSGYGAAVKRGLALCKDDKCDYAVCVHADGQYPPESIPEFIEYMENHTVDILQGSRHASGTALSGGMPLYKYAAGKLLTRFENLAFGLNLTDYHSGFLLYSRKALDTLPFESFSGSFDFDLEVIASARGRGLTIDELSIPTRYADEISYLNPVTYGLRVVGVTCRYLAGYYKQG